jgi:pimeloyl-ACP methyl ester carboxylesterase
MDTRTLEWNWRGQTIRLGADASGSGPQVLLLPALSSISTRREMRPLQERLGAAFRTVAMDWPGFGALPRPKLAWRPEAYRAFLKHIAATIVKPAATVAAGHAAGYAIAQAADEPGSLGPLSLVSPTWRGPLPTMAARRTALFSRLAQAADLPVAGALLYRINVNRPMIRMMARGHVYADPEWLSAERLREKLAVTEAPGARHASVRFVVGELDLFHERSDFLAAARRVNTPVQVLHPVHAPPRSRAEMTALAALPGIEAIEVPVGKLSVYEEHPEAVAPLIERFLRRHLARG